MSIAISRKAPTAAAPVSAIRVRRRHPTAGDAHASGWLHQIWVSTPDGLRCTWVVAFPERQAG